MSAAGFWRAVNEMIDRGELESAKKALFNVYKHRPALFRAAPGAREALARMRFYIEARNAEEQFTK